MYYYIQRITIEKNGSFKYDYMGAAEFEFGSIPKAYREFREGVAVHATGIKSKDGKALKVVVPAGVDAATIIADLKTLALEGDFETLPTGRAYHRVKEATNLKQAVENDLPSYRSDLNSWFSVNCPKEKVFFAFLGNELESAVLAKIQMMVQK